MKLVVEVSQAESFLLRVRYKVVRHFLMNQKREEERYQWLI